MFTIIDFIIFSACSYESVECVGNRQLFTTHLLYSPITQAHFT